MKNILPLFAILSFVGCQPLCERDVLDSSDRNDLAAASFSLSNGGLCGMGVFVGLNENGHERIFFLTARHVATYSNVTRTSLSITTASHAHWTIQTTADRWFTARKDVDAAWFELTEAECKEFAERKDLRYISLLPGPALATGSMAPATCTLSLLDYAHEQAARKPKAIMFCQDGPRDAEMDFLGVELAPIPFAYNRNLRTSRICIVPSRSKRLISPGDSGGPTFIRTSVNGKGVRALIGLAIGGNSIRKINTIQPLDDILPEIGDCERKLSDYPEFW